MLDSYIAAQNKYYIVTGEAHHDRKEVIFNIYPVKKPVVATCKENGKIHTWCNLNPIPESRVFMSKTDFDKISLGYSRNISEAFAGFMADGRRTRAKYEGLFPL